MTGGHKIMIVNVAATRRSKRPKTYPFHHHHFSHLEEEQKVSASMIGRSADDESEYSSRAEEIEAWLKTYGERYLGGRGATDSDNTNYYAFHSTSWKYVILDDRPSAAKPDTPLHSRFVHTKTEMGLTEKDAEKAISLLKFGPSTE